MGSWTAFALFALVAVAAGNNVRVQSVSRQATSCPLHGVDATSFVESPQAWTGAFGCGNLSAFGTCCSVSGLNRVGSKQDAVWTAISARLSNVPATCTTALNRLACAQCSADQGRIFSVLGYENDLVVCPEFARYAFAACASAVPTGSESTVGATYSSGADFLYHILDGTYHVSVQGGADCWNPVLPPCQQSDYTGFYTDCVDGLRSAFYAAKNPGSCQLGVPLPSPVFNLSCNVPCSEGSYLPVGSSTCAPCQAGTFALGGGFRVQSWSTWPAGLIPRMYCLDRNTNAPIIDCAPWYLNGTALVSGHISDLQVTVVEFAFELVRPGHVLFRWKVEAEVCSASPCDGFYVEIDDKPVINLTSAAIWTTSSFPLDAGRHVIAFGYSKDISVSIPPDQAQVNLLEIEGTDWSDSQCTKCPVGFFSREGASECLPCALNTATNVTGTGNACPACPEESYALVGSSVCTPRPVCTTDDYKELATDCAWDGSTFSRTFHSVWDEPHVCAGGVSLPASRPAPCAECFPGFRRIPPDPDCVGCPAGSRLVTTGGNGASQCLPCDAGTYALKVFEINEWGTWPHRPQTTTEMLDHNCSGTGCAGDWRLLETHIDTGVGHTFPALLTLNFTVHIDTVPAEISYNVSFICGRSCELSLQDFWNGTIVRSDHVYVSFFGDTRPAVEHHTLRIEEVGFHTFIFVFDPFSYMTSSAAGLMRLYDLRVTGAHLGSAYECTDCPKGTSSTAGQDVCSPCRAGTYADGKQAGACPTCPGNSVSFTAGSWNCTECGVGTRPNADHSDCITDCVFSVDQNTSYDLRGLMSDQMYGPMVDPDTHLYYLNVCKRVDVASSPCFNMDGEKISAFACQLRQGGMQGHNLGTRLSFVPFPAPHDREGFNLTYSGGEVCGNGQARQVTVTFLCDPDAGRGHPDHPQGHDDVEFTPCVYEFVWVSEVACPVCTATDYVEVVGECDPGTLTQIVSYVWADTPRRCWGGVTLPAPKTRNCSLSYTSCAPGYYASGTGADSCVPATAGHFSLGNGERIVVDTVVPATFDNAFQGAQGTPWSVERGGILKSGLMNSFLRTSRTYVRDGSISFEFKYSGGSTATAAAFAFKIDGQPAVSVEGERVMLAYESVRVPVSKGLHAFEWSFRNGASASQTDREHMVLLRNITFFDSSYAQSRPTACPAGFSQPNRGQSYCVRCPVNTWAAPESSTCTDCWATQYSLPGARACSGREPCNKFTDYEGYYTDCVNGMRSRVWEALEPSHCFVNDPANALPATETDIVCLPTQCPRGSYMREDGSCDRCPKGSVPDPSSKSCVKAKAGSAAVPVVAYFEGFQKSSTFPPGWSTNCSGLCGSRGWRARSHMMDSGFHGDEEVDSVATLDATFQYDGYLEFVYTVDSIVDGLDFFIDGQRQRVFRPPAGKRREASEVVRAPVRAGRHTFVWVYHQTQQTQGSVSVQSVAVVGAASGPLVGTELLTCPPGTFSPSAESPVCTPCSPGFVSRTSGSSQCERCGENEFQSQYGQSRCERCESGSFSKPGSSYCTRPCHFTWGNYSWNFTELGGTALGPITSPVSGNDDAFYVRLCEPIQNSSQCSDAYGYPLISYVCRVDGKTGASASGGNSMSISYSEKTRDVEVVYSGGECARGTTRVIMKCDLTATGVSSAYLTFSDGCNNVFTVTSVHGCRVCNQNSTLDASLKSTNADYDATAAECVSGTREVTFVRVGSCRGPALFKSYLACETPFQLPFIGIIALIAILGALGIAVGFLIWRNRKMHRDYSLLLSQRSDNEMSSVEGGRRGGNPLTSTALVEDSSMDLERSETL